MKDTYKVNFVQGSNWPIRLIITIDSIRLYFNVTTKQARNLAILLESVQNRNFVLRFFSEQNWEHCVNWLSDDSIQIVFRPTKAQSGKQIILTAKMAKDLSHDIWALLIDPYAPQQKLFPKPEAKVGDTILIHPQAEGIIGKCRGKEYFVVKIFPSGAIHVYNKTDCSYFIFDTKEYSIVSRNGQKGNINPDCPECKGTGKVLLFNFDPPCSLCFPAR